MSLPPFPCGEWTSSLWLDVRVLCATLRRPPIRACRAQLAHRLILGHADTQSDALALTDARQSLNYGALSERVRQLATYLRSRGVGPERIVGVCMERSAEAVIAFIAILESGGAYLPLDRQWPTQRLEYVLQDAKPVLVLSDRGSCEAVRAAGAEPVCIDSEWELIRTACADGPPTVASPQNLAYVIYTSGTTGAPKGALLTHFGLANLAHALLRVAVRGTRHAGSAIRKPLLRCIDCRNDDCPGLRRDAGPQ